MKFKSRQVLPKDLTVALLRCEYFKSRKAACAELLRLTNRHVSTVYQVKVCFENEEQMYWIKISKQSRQEYLFLQSTYERFRNVPQLSVVEPITCLEDFSALITKHANGELLSSRIKRRLNRLSALLGDDEHIKRECYTCGKWLASLHTYELPSAQHYSREELIEYIDKRLMVLVDRSCLEKGFRERVLAYLQQTLSTVPPEYLVRVKTHGDYAPYNILVSDDELVVLDPSVGTYFGRLDNYCSRYEDVVHFYNFVKGMSNQIVGSRTRKALASRFINGYNDNNRLAVDKSSPVFKAFLVKYKLLDVLNTWPSIMRGLIGEKERARGFQRWFQRICKPA